MELYNNDRSFELVKKPVDKPIQGVSSKLCPKNTRPNGKKFYIESYGCAMNFSDSEIVASILSDQGYRTTNDYRQADLILINTCSIREKAEQRVRNRLHEFNKIKRKKNILIGVLGCMAERLKEKLLEEEKLVDIVAGPDAYRSLPQLIVGADSGQKTVNVLLSREETYGDISPVRLSDNGISAFVSIMRGCDNICSFCVVPFTRGRERSRDALSIVEEVKILVDKGYREVTLLGQNVDSYRWSADRKLKGKKLIEAKYDAQRVINFADLLAMVAEVSSSLRVRFSTSHPKDMTDDVLYTIAKYPNICNYVHLPVQSGSSEVLAKMNRNYTREWYFDRIRAIQQIIPNCSISTDIITGFCGETEEQHQETFTLMQQVNFELAYMFYYSERPGTLAAKRYEDDVPLSIKKRRLQEIVDLQRLCSIKSNERDIGRIYEVLVEGRSKKSEKHFFGRTSQNKVVVFPKEDVLKGQYVEVKVLSCTAATLIGELVKE